MLYECVQCVCGAGLVAHSKYVASGEFWAVFSCDVATCGSSGCFR